MKKVFVLALAFAGLTTAVKAQKGSILVGGDLGISSSTDKTVTPTNKTTAWAFDPTVGYQFSDHFTAGITAQIQSVKNDNGSSFTQTSVGVGPFIRYSKSLSDNFAVYGQLQALFGSQTTSPSTTTVSQTQIGFFPAAFINLKNNFGLNFSFGGISYGSTKPSGGSASSSFDFNFGKTANIGISKNFGGK